MEQDFGESKQKFLYIPEPHNDFIFSILSEELGFIGCAIVILLFAIFVWRGILIAMKAPDMFGSLIAIGITSLIAVQAIINIAVVTGSIPNTGMPLPFFSYGGTALLITLCSMRNFVKYFKSRGKSLIWCTKGTEHLVHIKVEMYQMLHPLGTKGGENESNNCCGRNWRTY